MAVTSDDALVKAGVAVTQAGKSIFDSASNVATKTYNTVTDTNFLVGAGVSIAASLFASKVKRPSLNFASLAATTQVALAVASTLKSGASTINQIANAEKGLTTSSKLKPIPVNVISRASDIDNEVEDKSSSSINFVRYPTDLATAYSLSLGFVKRQKYEFDIKSQQTVKFDTEIRLPLPSNLIDVVSLQYSNIDVGPIRGAFAENLRRTLQNIENENLTAQQFAELMDKEISNVIEKATAEGGSIARVIGRSALGRTALNSAIDIALNNTPNPHTTITFNGVNLRAFQFSWRFSPNNINDSDELKNLIYTLKSKSLPRKQGELLLKFPDFVRLKIYPKVLNDMFNFRTMVLDSVTVNYAPSGNISFYRDDMPTEVEVVMSLREIDIQTSEDYDVSLANSRPGLGDR